ncbi:21034_t:CDS:2 [Cetraspora pellucida]|uniref:21034_t:CDS:1 n=1 Tax=Cetraspora pellucida TaxID=1433469 RepID=A0A9N9I445_9GLOM|nr:21034_t:CDS:2 [Cetraspora pellucida]
MYNSIAIGQWFAYIDCTKNSTSYDMITAQGNGSSAIVLYSKDESCTAPPILSDIKVPVFNQKYANCYNAISNSVQELGQPPNAVIRNSNKSHPDGNPFNKYNEGGSNSDAKDNSAQPYQTAMVVLYTISGVVLGLFFLVVITNVIINRVRSQQDSGISSSNDPSQSPKHVGIAKTVLESFPVYFFSLRNNPDVVNKDLEGGKDIKDIGSKEMQTDDKNNIPLNDLPQETNKKDETSKLSEIEGDKSSNNDNKTSNNQSISETSVLPPSISNKVTEEQLTCPICLGDFESGEELRILPCHHQYHTSCIDPWLLEISTLCPMCKADYTSWNEESSASHGEASTSVVPTPQNETDETTSSITSSTTSSHTFPHFRWIKYLTSARRARNERRRNRRSRNGHSDNLIQTDQNES